MLFQSLKNRKDGLQNKKNLMSNPNLVPGKKYKKKTHTFFLKYAELTYKSILWSLLHFLYKSDSI